MTWQSLLTWLLRWFRPRPVPVPPTLPTPRPEVVVPDLPTIPGLPPAFASLPAVQMTPPPSYLLGDTVQFITEAVKDLPPNEKGRLTWIATTKGVNLALVDKVNDHVNVTAWVGKDWGQPLAAGIAGNIHW